MYKDIIILGSTGSIGTQALDVVRKLGINVVGLSANRSVEKIARQVEEFRPRYVCLTDEEAREEFSKLDAARGVTLLRGKGGLARMASVPGDALVLNAVVGIAGLEATLATARRKKDLALANKESLVTGGRLVMDAVKKNGIRMLPVDSEHSAIFQCLQDANSAPSLRKIILTASGGPFFGYTREQLENVTRRQALKHPNWSMGGKITIDSATLMNKGLELIEAVWLFGLRPEDINIVVHRQSIIHSAVQFADNSVIAQMGVPDMRIPIQYAVTYPERMESPARELDFYSMKDLTFDRADSETFLCLRAAMEAIDRGGLYPCRVNGANERAVALFLEDRIGFLDIGDLVLGVLSALDLDDMEYTVENVYRVDRMARDYVYRSRPVGENRI